jgi:hypothetical protein
MPKSRSVPVAAAVLAAACALPAAGASRLTPGQEFIYTGTLEWKQSGGNVPSIVYRAPIKVSALVTAADADQGTTIIVLRDIRPEKRQGQEPLPPYAQVVTERYRPDLTLAPGPPRPPRPLLGDPLVQLTWNRPLPFGFRSPFGSLSDLRVGQSWSTDEHISLALVRSPLVDYRVTGETKVHGRCRVRIEKHARSLPEKNPVEGGSVDLTDYAATFCVDRDTGLLVSDEWRASVFYAIGEQHARIDVRAVVALKETRQLAAREIASRVKQAEAIGRTEQLVFDSGPDADRKQRVAEAKQTMVRFRREYPSGAYAPALTPIEAYLEPEARRLELQGDLAPDFRIKDLAGKEQTVAAYRGKLILLNFFASW